jgi:hypothetical protein
MVGLDRKRFEELLVHFKEVYREINHCSLEERLPRKFIIVIVLKGWSNTPHEEDLLFFTLVSIKCGNTHDQIGIFFGMDGSGVLLHPCQKKPRKRFIFFRKNLGEIRLLT